MACFVGILGVPPSGTRDLKLSWRVSARSDGFCEAAGIAKKCVSVSKTTKGAIRAMGVAKYKGTQRREKQLTEMIEKKVEEAKEVCQGDQTSDECKVAWDEVEEVSQAMADLRLKMEKQDPLESYCQENPETDECRLYED